MQSLRRTSTHAITDRGIATSTVSREGDGPLEKPGAAAVNVATHEIPRLIARNREEGWLEGVVYHNAETLGCAALLSLVTGTLRLALRDRRRSCRDRIAAPTLV